MNVLVASIRLQKHHRRVIKNKNVTIRDTVDPANIPARTSSVDGMSVSVFACEALRLAPSTLYIS